MRGISPLITPNYKGAMPLYNPQKTKKYKKKKTTEEGKASSSVG